MDLAFRPRRATEIVDAAVRLYLRHFGTCVTLAVVAEVPMLVVRLAGLAGLTGLSGAVSPARAAALGALATPLFLAYYTLVSAAFAALSDDAVRTDAPDVARALRRARERGWACLGVFGLLALVLGAGTLVAGLAAGVVGVATVMGAGGGANPAAAGAAALGIMALVLVPGAYVFTRLITAIPACVVEDVGPVAAVKLAWARGGGHFWHAFAVLVVSGLILLVPLLLSLGASAMLDTSPSLGVRAAGALVGTGVSVLVAPLLPLATQLLYYDLRVRAEGYDLEQMVGALGRTPAAPAGA